ncbi:MAG: hypothetical protein K2K37_06400 [Muribaculaceae bacterium]|nr:hypothetical protein [Muribaculaceae bacterium]
MYETNVLQNFQAKINLHTTIYQLLISFLTMKRVLITFFTLICISLGLNAQRIEVFGGYSYGSLVGNTPQINPPYDTAIGAPMNNLESNRENGALTLGVNARIYNKLSIGLSWTGINSYTQYMSPLNSEVVHSVKQSSNTVMFNVKYDWLEFWKINLYSRAGLGAIFFGDPSYSEWLTEWDHNLDWRDGKPESCKRLAWQVSFVGVEFRPIKWVGVFAEGGIGRQGALLAGLKVFL